MIKHKPTSPGTRWKVCLGLKFKNKKYTPRCLISSKKPSYGRNNQGIITSRHRGGGVKRNLRLIDFKRKKHYVLCRISRIDYDPSRNALISMLNYFDGDKRYIIHINNTKVGDIIVSGFNIPPKNGNFLPLENIPIGSKICCIENKPGMGAVFARSAGNYFVLLSRDNDYCLLRTSSGETRKVNSKCFATIGEVGNLDFYLKKIGKAGTNRLKGIRPTVRGVAMNPIDHPHGGGEGKTSSKRNPVSYSGKLTKGFRTRRNKRTSKLIVKHR
ncbi:50S ribosomal protein L2 [Candidatus Vidania fulgoroideae]|uniref:Large ribosomal subunit protein uL2 n=1 Tax=Candidatus Vidania fulgoroideorum TaxID=881286 RepID=A0A975AEJ2_9PROT|nr:50S ribosomal protein L2 [Candidatus Vidania fulgoroideae]